MTPGERFCANEALIGYVFKSWNNLLKVLPYDDIMQEASLALWKACKSYDPEKKYDFSTFAIKAIENQFKAIWCKNRKKFAEVELEKAEEQVHEEDESKECVKQVLCSLPITRRPDLQKVLIKQVQGFTFKAAVIAILGQSQYRRLLKERKEAFEEIRKSGEWF